MCSFYSQECDVSQGHERQHADSTSFASPDWPALSPHQGRLQRQTFLFIYIVICVQVQAVCIDLPFTVNKYTIMSFWFRTGKTMSTKSWWPITNSGPWREINIQIYRSESGWMPYWIWCWWKQGQMCRWFGRMCAVVYSDVRHSADKNKKVYMMLVLK